MIRQKYPENNEPNLKQPIIFIGMPRSGTTIISEIIFQHEDLAWISNFQDRSPKTAKINKTRAIFYNKLWQLGGKKPQLNQVKFYNKYIFKPSEAYNFWDKITENQINFSRSFLLNKTASPQSKIKIRFFLNQLVKYQNKKRLAFKITGPGRIEYLNSLLPNAIFVEITREPLANIRSLLKVDFWKKEGGAQQIWWESDLSRDETKQVKSLIKDPVLLSAWQYKKVRQETTKELKKVGVNKYTLRFEDFIKNPTKEINQLLSQLNLKPSKAINQYLKTNKIIDRNIKAQEYFDPYHQKRIKEILADLI